MTIVAQTGTFAFAVQSAKGSPVSASASFYRHKAMQINMGPSQDARVFPLEVGGTIVPTGAYKGMVFFAGQCVINPRLYGSYGHLLKAALGNSAAPVAGIYSETSITDGIASQPAGAMRAIADETPLTVVTKPGGVNACILKIVATAGIKVGSGPTPAVTFTVEGGVADATKTLTSADIPGPGVYYFRMTGDPTGPTVSIDVDRSVGSENTLAGTYSIGWVYSTTSSAGEHVFNMLTTDFTQAGWLTTRTVVPGATGGTTELGIEGQDVRITGLSINMPQNGIVSSRLDLVGRVPRLVDNPLGGSEDWDGAWVANEDFPSAPVACVIEGGVYLPGWIAAEAPLTSLNIQWANNFTSPQQEMIIGSYYPDDFATLSRGMTLQATLKWSDSLMYRLLHNNSSSLAAWSPIVWTSPFHAKTLSPSNISSAVPTQWSLRVDAPTVMWTMPNPPALAGGDIVTAQLQGQVLEPLSGASMTDFAKFTLTNGQTATY